MKPAGEQLQRLLSRLHLDEAMLGWKAVSLWPELAGEKVANHTNAVRFQRGTLVVEVDNPSWMSELSYIKHHLVEEINKHLDRPVVKTIVFRPRSGAVPKKETKP